MHQECSTHRGTLWNDAMVKFSHGVWKPLGSYSPPLLTRERVFWNAHQLLSHVLKSFRGYSNSESLCWSVYKSLMCMEVWYGSHLPGCFAFYSLSPFKFWSHSWRLFNYVYVYKLKYLRCSVNWSRMVSSFPSFVACLFDSRNSKWQHPNANLVY